jgi:hypothetical protein
MTASLLDIEGVNESIPLLAKEGWSLGSDIFNCMRRRARPPRLRGQTKLRVIFFDRAATPPLQGVECFSFTPSEDREVQHELFDLMV